MDRLKLEDLRAFVHVVDAGGVSEAARRLGVSKSVVSARVTSLEQCLEARLLRRSANRVEPTEKGLEFHGKARSILQELDAAAEGIADGDGELRGAIRVAMPMTLGTMHLGGMLLDFLRANPKLEVAVDLNDRYVDVAGGGYDLAIRVGRMEDSALIGRKLAVVHRVVCASPDYLAAHGTPETIRDLQSHSCIGYANIGTSPMWQFEESADGGGAAVIPMRCRLLVNNGDVMRDAAVRGLGLIVLPTFIVGPALVSGALTGLKLDRRPTPAVLHAVYPATPHLPRAVRAFVDHLAASIGDPPFWDAELAHLLG